MKYLFIILTLYSSFFKAQTDTLYLKINFLYGSKPIKKYKDTEVVHFGGLHGGHVSIELDNIDYSFGTSGSFHFFSHKNNLHSSFEAKNTDGKPAYMVGWKYASVYIPLTQEQYYKSKQILSNYLNETPYDYAFCGMRCASSTHEILAQINILKKRKKLGYIITSFYPKQLRRKLLFLSKKNGYKVVKQEGRLTRKWEKD